MVVRPTLPPLPRSGIACRRRPGNGGITLGDEPARRRARSGAGTGRGRARRSHGASCVDVVGVPRADGPCTATPAVPAGGVVVHALAGAPWGARSARRVTAGQRVVAGSQRAAAAGRLRNRRAPRWPGRAAFVASRTPLAGVQRETNGAQLVPSTQREHRGELPGASGARRSRKRTGALLHERRSGARALRARARRRAPPGAGAIGSARSPGRRSAARNGRGVPLAETCAPGPLSARPRRRAVYRRRAASRADARLRGDRPAPAAPVRVVRPGARRTAAAQAHSRRQPDLRLALRGATRMALSAHAVRSPCACTHDPPTGRGPRDRLEETTPRRSHASKRHPPHRSRRCRHRRVAGVLPRPSGAARVGGGGPLSHLPRH